MRDYCLNTMPRAKLTAKRVIISFRAAAATESGRKADIVPIICPGISYGLA